MSLDDQPTMEPNPKRMKTESEDTNGTSKTQLPAKRVKAALYSASVVAKIWHVAARALGSANPPILFPEYTSKDSATYVYRSLDFWTSGFFPGSLYLILERLIKYPRDITDSAAEKDGIPFMPHPLQLEHLCKWWTANLHQNALKRDTHDLGFMIAPWAMKAWELQRDPAAYNSLVMAAHSLASRFNSTTQCLQSWDVCVTNRYSFTDPSKDFLVIIDNMLNLDLLFWAARETSNSKLFDIARAHAKTTQKHHIRKDNTTFHVVNFDAKTGDVKAKFTNQGYSDDSCWARGQAWGILGFMQTFGWTRDRSFLETAKKLADYFLAHLPDDGVPYWDFTAPILATSPRDTSAAMIAACGLLLLHKALKGTSDGDYYLREAFHLVDATVTMFLNPPTIRLQTTPRTSKVPVYPEGCLDEKHGDGFDKLTIGDHFTSKMRDTILHGATINNYEFAPRRWSNHGLVYADYYYILFGNILLELDLVNGKSQCID